MQYKYATKKGAFHSFIQILGIPIDEISNDKLEIFQEVLMKFDLYNIMAEQSAIPLSRAQRRKLEKNAKKKK